MFIQRVVCLGGKVCTPLIKSTTVVLFSFFLGGVLFRIKINNTNV